MPTRAQIDAARRGLGVLRSMRGGAGKLAQLADLIDPGWAPAEDRAAFEALLVELRRGAPEPLPSKRVERLLRDAWGGRVSDHLAGLEFEPVARASAGQVHRGELDDGRPVAIKLLHPGLEDALRADLGNLNLLAQLATTAAPGLDPRAIAAELRERVLEEMDLEQEAQSQRRFARAYRDHPFIQVPLPVTELARTGVLVSEWVDGAPFDDVVLRGAAERDRYGEILLRFHIGAMFHTGAFHADPHPGNHLLRADGRVAFLDYGSVGRAEPAWLAAVLDAADAADAGDGPGLALGLTALGYLSGQPEVDASALRDPSAAGELLMRHGRLPARDLLVGRMVAGLAVVLTRLGAAQRRPALERELRRLGDAAPGLGEAEAGFWVRRGHSHTSAIHALRRAA